MATSQLQEVLASAKHRALLCIGDVMLDRFVYGEATRISPEAPVPILNVTREREMPGGAANVALNARALGARVHLLGVVGDDVAGRCLREHLASTSDVETILLIDPARQTTLKTRYIATGQQMLRVDAEDRVTLSADIEAELLEEAEKHALSSDAILVSDYGKGTLSPRIKTALNALAEHHKIPLIIDPKGTDYAEYGAPCLIKPNARELAEFTAHATGTDDEIATALQDALAKCGAEAILVTRSGAGASLGVRGRDPIHLRGERRDVFDVSGAGDTALAALGVVLATGADLMAASQVALQASGLAVTKAGTAQVTSAELLADESFGALSIAAACEKITDWRGQGLRIGFTNGCFDLLHPGHLAVIEAAKLRCDKLIVGLNSDASVQRLKGVGRPVNGEVARARVLGGLASVDGVVLFCEETPEALIQALQPDLLVKGGDYRAEDVVGGDIVRARGGEVYIAPLVEGYSTTATLARSQQDG